MESRDRVWAAAALMVSLVLAGCGGTSDSARSTGTSSGSSGSSGSGGAGGSGPSAKANGTVAAWQSLPAMPEPRANHCSAVVSGYLVVVGGNYKPPGASDFVKTDAVVAAAINGDGTIGAWKQIGKARSAVTECTATADGERLVLVDGLYDNTADEGQVWVASLGSDGALGPWTSLGAVPSGQRMLSSEATAPDGTLYVMATQLPDAGNMTMTYRAELGATLGAWSSDAWLPGFRAQAQYAFTEDFVYALGGYTAGAQGNEVVARVDGASVRADGSVGPAFTTAALPAPTSFGEAAAADDYVFVVGGKTDIFGSGVATVLSAPIGPDGKLTAWSTQTPLPEPRTNHDMVLAGDYLYVTGGASDGPGLDTVFSAQVRF